MEELQGMLKLLTEDRRRREEEIAKEKAQRENEFAKERARLAEERCNVRVRTPAMDYIL